MTTTKQIAERCGVSEQAIRAWCRKNQVTKDNAGSFVISETIELAIYEHYGVYDAKDDAKETTHVESRLWEMQKQIALLELELKLLKEQLQQKDEQIANLQKNIDEEHKIWMTSLLRIEDKQNEKKWWQVWK